jgi:hypothetical protein
MLRSTALFCAFVCISMSHADVKSTSISPKRIPLTERPVIFSKQKASDKPAVSAAIKYEEFIKSGGPYKYYEEKEWNYLAFIGPLSGKGEEFPGLREDFLTSDELESATQWPLRYVVRIHDPVINLDPGPTDFRPYIKNIQTDARRFDISGKELDVITEKPTGRRVYRLGQTHYLGTEALPRKLVSVFEWKLCNQAKEPRLVPCYSDARNEDGSWRDIRNNDGAKFDRGAFINLFAPKIKGSSNDTSTDKEFYAYHNQPIKPVILSDYALSPEGKVTKGKAMCVADCPKGLQFKLLKAGDIVPAVKP